MNAEILDMELSHLTEYAELFVAVFNSEPWNDLWTKETAVIRIENMMKTNTFIGKAIYSENDLKGIIWGQTEQYFDGIHFQIQEFCIKKAEQHQGYGKALLRALKQELLAMGVTNIYLITSKGERTQGYYARRGFITSDCMILMSDSGYGEAI